jgi:hypothetical protein
MAYFWKIAKLQRVKCNLWFHFKLDGAAQRFQSAYDNCMSQQGADPDACRDEAATNSLSEDWAPPPSTDETTNAVECNHYVFFHAYFCLIFGKCDFAAYFCVPLSPPPREACKTT